MLARQKYEAMEMRTESVSVSQLEYSVSTNQLGGVPENDEVQFPGIRSSRVAELPSPLANKLFAEVETSTLREYVLFPAQRSKLRRQGFLLAALAIVFHNWAFSYVFSSKDALYGGDDQNDLAVDRSRVIFWIYPFFMFLTGSFSGWLMFYYDWFNYARAAILSTVVQSALLVGLGFLTDHLTSDSSFSIALAIRSVQGVASGMAHAASISVLIRTFPKSKGAAAGTIILWIGVGIMSGPAFGAALESADYSPGASLLLAALGFVFSGLMNFFCQLESTSSPPVEVRSFVVGYIQALWKVLITTNTVFCFLIVCLAFTEVSFIGLEVMAERRNSNSKGIAPLILGCICFIAASPYVGLLADRITSTATISIGLVLNLVFLNFLTPLAGFSSFFIWKDLSEIPTGVLWVALLFLAVSLALAINPSFRIIIKAAEDVNLEVGAGVLTAANAVGASAGIGIGSALVSRSSFIIGIRIFILFAGFLLLSIVLDVAYNKIQKRLIRKLFRKHKSDKSVEGSEILNTLKSISRDTLKSPTSPSASVSVRGGFFSEEKTEEPDEREEKLSAEELVALNKRKAASLKELIDSESTYVKYLRFLVNKYVIPLEELTQAKRRRGGLRYRDVEKVFQDLKALKTMHLMFLEDLTKCFHMKPDMSNLGEISHNFITVLFKFLQFFKLYTTYVSTYQDRIAIVGKMKKSKTFNDFVEELQKTMMSGQGAHIAGGPAIVPLDPEEDYSGISTGQTVESYLIMPIQRVPRYVLLLKEIIRNTHVCKATREERKKLQTALEQVQAMCDIINKSEASRGNALRMLELQDKITGLTETLILPHRKFIQEGSATRIAGGVFVQVKNVQLLLFNDILLVTNSKYSLKEQIDLSILTILSLKQEDISTSCFERNKKAHTLMNEDVESRGLHLLMEGTLAPLTLIFDSSEMKMKWEADLIIQINGAKNMIGAIKTRVLSSPTLSSTWQ